MAILKESDKKEVQKRLAVMNKTVKVITFLPESDIIVPDVVNVCTATK